MMNFIKYIDQKFYPFDNNNWDDKIFRNKIKKHINKESTVLDFGCGRGNVKEMIFLNDVKFIAGVDLDDGVFENQNLHERKKIDMVNFHIPYDDNTFDIVFSDNVMEHVENPNEVFCEINRVLKTDGYFFAKTPNKYHYVALISHITPTNFHVYYNKLRGRKERDTFPTFYRCNSKKTIKKYANKFGFIVDEIDLVEKRPEYLRISFFSYLFGLIYERVVNSTKYLKSFRVSLSFRLKKTKTI